MSRQEKRLQQIERSALREAQKALRRHPEQPVTREELLSLRVQTLTIGDRATLALAGSLSVTGGFHFLRHDEWWKLGIFLTLLGAVVLVLGAYGWKRTLSETIENLGAHAADILINVILGSLD
ncbi:MAG TPA: hypothetical protein VGE76_14905 [Opitutaceae bacterium]